MHMGIMDIGITVIVSTEQKGILQFNQNSDIKKAVYLFTFRHMA
jgi:hypothetical protein